MKAADLIRFGLLCSMCLGIRAYGQNPIVSPTSLDIVECESAGCTPGTGDSPRWSFSSRQGRGHFASGDQQLFLAHMDASSIAVRRVEGNGASALYMGRIEGERVTGVVLYYDGGKTGATHAAAWNGVLKGSPAALLLVPGEQALKLPFSLRECESNRCLQLGTQYSIVWTFPSRSGQGWLGDTPRPMVIEDLGPDFLLVRRVEPSIGMAAFYFGLLRGKEITGGVLYFSRERPNQPRADTWFGKVQDAFIPEEAMSPAYSSVLSKPQDETARSDRPNPNVAPASRPAAATPSAPVATGTLSSPHSDFTGRLGMCEDSDGCSLWTFKNGRGSGHWRNGAEAQLVIDHLDDTSITVNRLDTSGVGRGISARYEAQRHGDWIEGTLSWEWPGHGPGKTLFRGAFPSFADRGVAANAAQLPRHLLVCDAAEDCSDWNLRGATGHFRSADSNNTGSLIVQSFDDDHIVVRTHSDTGLAGADIVWYGQRRGNLVTGVASWQWPGHGENSSGTTFWQGNIENLPTFRAAALTGPKPYNLIGLWTPNGVRRDDRNFYEFAQYGAELHILRPSPQDPKTRFTWFVSNQLAAKKIAGLGLTGDSWSANEVTLRDPDHVLLKDGTLLERTTVPIADDVPCNQENTAGVDGYFAFLRSQSAFAGKDSPLAFCWASVSAKEENPSGELALGVMYHEAVGTPQNYPLSFHWIALAASKNNVTALNALAVLYDKGEGTPKDPAKAQQVRDSISHMQADALWSNALHGNSWQSEMLRNALGGIITDTMKSFGQPDCTASTTNPGKKVCSSF
jgi:hypothetical protein